MPVGYKYPKKWKDCPSSSEVIIADKFFVFKTPITRSRNMLDADKQFVVQDAVDKIEDLGKQFVGWIDLTNVVNGRYYSSAEVTSKGIQYYKIALPGKGVIPSPEHVSEFIKICKELKDKDGIIGVHSTYGLNRPGYLICKYMISEMDYSPQNAITHFAEYYPPGIYRGSYLAELCGNEDVPEIPERPEWDL